MERFNAEQFTDFLGKIGRLKSVPRHCVTPEGVQETVAAHCWRAAMMAWLMKDELGEIDIDKVIHMCLLHDLGEAVTGDIPAFWKGEAHRQVEREAVDRLLAALPPHLYEEAGALFAEMEALETKEAKVYKALDKLEAVISHNESDIGTWLPLEYELQQTYAKKSVEGFPFLESLQELAVKRTREKIAQEEQRRKQNGAGGNEDRGSTTDASATDGRKTEGNIR
ncbi:MAG: HD domain-containing protein [Eubacteriales bacterium]|nr:HD domain-containing protein [Eubacteriales bacterium]